MKDAPALRPESLDLKQSIDELQRTIACDDRLQPAVLVDRDGTLIVERGYLRSPSKAKLLPGASEALALLNRSQMPVVVITNQSAIGRGIITLTEFESVNQALWDALQVAGAYYDGLYYCPHDPTVKPSCLCRKPQAGLLLQAAADLKLDLARSYVIGDKRSDIEAGVATGSRTVLVLTGFGESTRQELGKGGYRPDRIADDLLDACRWIVRTRQ